MRLPEAILITGANGQSAVQLARKLLQQGCKLLLLAHHRTDRIDQVRADFPEKCWLKKCDLSSFEETKQALTEMLTESGQNPTGLIHTAAVRSYDAKVLVESDPSVWTEIIRQNIFMAYNVLRNVLPIMLKQKQGKIVLFGSNVTRTGLPYGTAYAASKAALANLARSLAWEIAEQNIQINVVSPAPLETKLEEDYEGDYLAFRKEYFAAYKKSHPAHKLVSLDDITKIVISLLDLDVTSVSGEEIYITGGVL